MSDQLYFLTAELRLELAGEMPIVLHPHVADRGQRTTKRAVRDEDTSHESGGGTWRPQQASGYGTRIGLPYTLPFERRLSHRDWWGLNELAASSIGEVGDWCRSRHRSDLHRCPGRSTSLCERIVAALAEFGEPIGHIAWREKLDQEVTYALAVQALRHAYAWRHRRLHQYMRSATDRERDLRVSCPLCEGRPVRMRRSRVA